MIRANKVSPRGHWTGAPADTIVLDHTDRHRRRVVMNAVRGLEFLLDLPEAIALRHGDALVLDDGRLVEIVAAPEELAEVRGRDPNHSIRLAWHLGNRHLPVEIAGPKLRIRRDPVVQDMLRGLGAKVVEIEGPFEPETGAYALPHAPEEDHAHHGHDHGHSHDHGHDHHGHAHQGHDHQAHDHQSHDHHGHDHGHHHDHDGHDHGQHRHGHGHSHD